MFIRWGSTWKRLRNDTTRWLQNCRRNWTRSSLSAKTSRNSSKSWSDLWLNQLSTRRVIAPSRRTSWKTGKIRRLPRMQNSTSTAISRSLWGTSSPTKKKNLRRKSSLLMVCISSTSSSWRLRTKLWTRRLKIEMRRTTSWGRRWLKQSSFWVIPERRHSMLPSRRSKKLRDWMSCQSNSTNTRISCLS